MVSRALPVVALAGCFGSGPVPMPPSDIDFIYRAPAPTGSCDATYIADVALGDSGGIAVTAPYAPWENNCGGPASGNFQIVTFSKSGGSAMTLGTISGNGNQVPRVGASGSATGWASFDTSNGDIDVGPAGAMIAPTGGGGPSPAPGGLALDASSAPPVAYIAGWNPSSNVPTADPYFPCCSGGTGGQNPSVFSLHSISLMSGAAATTLPVTPRFWCENVRECLIGTSSALVYVQHADAPKVASIDLFPKNGTTSDKQVELGTLDSPPAGLAADESHAAWTSSFDFTQLSSIQSPTSLPAPKCEVGVAPLTGPSTVLLSTDKFSCGDVAVDGGDVYFLIIDIEDSGHGLVERTLGIGRIAIADPQLESVALGISGFGAGPRGITVDADSLYLLDPLLVARIPKALVGGHHDFTP